MVYDPAVSATARIEVIEGAPPRTVEVPRAGLEVGRGEAAGLVLDAPSLSKRHARFFWEGDDLLVEDLGSTNKIHRDGQAIVAPTSCADGDELVLGEVVIRVELAGAETGTYGLPTAELCATDQFMSPRPEEPVDAAAVEKRAAEILPVVESFFHVRDPRELGRRVAEAVKQKLAVSRVALIEVDEEAQRFRPLGLEGAKDHRFVSNSIVGDARRRGLALYQLGAVGRPMPGSLVNARATSAVAAALRARGDKLRVLYADTLPEHAPRIRPLTWRHAFELQLFAASAASAFDALSTQKQVAEERVRFEGLRRHFSPAVVEQLSLLSRPERDITAPRLVPASVLFADLSGFTQLTDRWKLQPESLVSLLDMWLDVGTRAVFAHTGTLDKYVGDAIMAVFGAPFNVQGAAVHAVACALDMQRAIAQLAQVTGEDLAVTAGVSSGPVLSCAIGSKRRHELTVFGETVGVASRLREAAERGAVLVGEGTAGEVAHAVNLAEAGELVLPNRRTARAWRVLGLK